MSALVSHAEKKLELFEFIYTCGSLNVSRVARFSVSKFLARYRETKSVSDRLIS